MSRASRPDGQAPSADRPGAPGTREAPREAEAPVTGRATGPGGTADPASVPGARDAARGTGAARTAVPPGAPGAGAPATLHYRRAFERREAAGSPSPAWLQEIRREALERFETMGFPTTRNEAWRSTNVSFLARTPHEIAPPRALDAATIETLLLHDDAAGARIVFVNGHHAPHLSRPGPGVSAEPLSEALRSGDAGMRGLLGRLACADVNPFTELNTAMFADGALVRIAGGAAPGAPVHIVFVSSGDPAPGNGHPVVSFPRCLVVAGPRSQAAIVESYLGTPESGGCTSAVTEIEVEDGAVVEHTRVQRESTAATHIGALHARVGRQAAFTSHSLALGARLSRVDVRVLLSGEGAGTTLNGLYVLDGARHADHHTVVDHAAPHGTSRELYKGVLDGASRGVFDGTIIVRPGAQKTDSRQENRNLILSPDALVDTKPTLMINADDVKCSHAATIGQMDETQLFYLKSRALGTEAARRLLVRAFIVDVIQRVSVAPLRAALEEALASGLDGEGGKEARP